MRATMSFDSKRTELFTIASELVHEFGASAAVGIVSSDEMNMNTFISSNWLKILAKCVNSETPHAFHYFESEDGYEIQMPTEIDILKKHATILKQRHMEVLDTCISHMNPYEVIELEKKLRDKMRCIEDRKAQLFINEFEDTRRLAEQVQDFLRSTRDPGTASNVGPQVNAALPSTSSAAPISTDNGQSNHDDPSFSSWLQNLDTPDSGTH